MGTRSHSWHITQDTPEEIQMCLNCKRSKCIDCISSMRRRAKEERAAARGWKKKYNYKTLFYFVDGHRVNENAIKLLHYYPTAKNDKELGEYIHMTSGSVAKVRERLDLPRVDKTPEAEKTRLAQYYLDAIANMEAH